MTNKILDAYVNLHGSLICGKAGIVYKTLAIAGLLASQDTTILYSSIAALGFYKFTRDILIRTGRTR